MLYYPAKQYPGAKSEQVAGANASTHSGSIHSNSAPSPFSLCRLNPLLGIEAGSDPLQDLSLSLLQICCQMTGLALWTVAAHALLKIDAAAAAGGAVLAAPPLLCSPTVWRAESESRRGIVSFGPFLRSCVSVEFRFEYLLESPH